MTQSDRDSRDAARDRRGRSRRLIALAGALALVTGGYVVTSQAQAKEEGRAAADSAQVWVTTADGSKRLAKGDDVAFDSSKQDIDLSVDPSSKQQEFTGAGASITESSAHLLAQLPGDKRDAIMKELFSREGDGIGLDYLRQPLGGSDFVAELPYYSYEDTKGSFSIDRDTKEIIPLLKQALGINSKIRVMGTPWSPPAWMKDGGKLEGGKLKPEDYDAYADYLVKAVEAYKDAGVPITDLTAQNEPLFEATYPSMNLPASQEADFLRVLDGKLTAAGLKTNLFAYDHNWDHPEYPLEVLDKTKDIDRVKGAAFHCYGGQPEAEQKVRDTGKQVFFTECSGTDSDDASRTFADSLTFQAENLDIRSLRSGAQTVVLWNMALDEHGGPQFGNCDTKCNGVVEVDGDTVNKNAEYYSLGHVAKFVDSGAHVIKSSSQDAGGVEDVAFENPDGSRAAVVLNSSDAAKTFSVTEAGKSLKYELPAGAVATFTWSGAPTGS
jgi:glucosylceramidase